jgi:hypothetical protein
MCVVQQSEHIWPVWVTAPFSSSRVFLKETGIRQAKMILRPGY